MSDIRPPDQASGEVVPFPGTTGSGSGGSGPDDPGIEARVAKLEADVGHIRSDAGDIKTLLGRLAPRIDEMYGRQATWVTQQDFANLRMTVQQDFANLRVEISQRPTRRQTIFDIFTLVTLIGAVLAIGAKLAH
jgi:hypothetical protein